jgi:hypothetical protein
VEFRPRGASTAADAAQTGTSGRLTAPWLTATLWPHHHRNLWGEPVTRLALIFVALAATAALMLAACSPAPAAPALTDPKDILAKTVLSLKDFKTVEFTGSLTGILQVAQLGGDLDLSTTKISGAADVPNKKARFMVDAPAIMGTKIDAIVLDTAAYFKIDGLLAAMAGGVSGKYTKTDVPASSGAPMSDPAQIAKAVDELNKALNLLPTPPTKGADEKCGDTDCYHVTLKMTAADVAKINPSAASSAGEFTLDVWTRKNDLRPGKISLSVTTPDTGTIGMTFEFKYDVNVSVEAPSADQIAP